MARTKTYAQYLRAVKARAGMEELTLIEADELNFNFNSRYNEARTASKWQAVSEERTPVAGLIAYDQAGETEIQKVWGVYDSDPYGVSTPTEIKAAITTQGIKLRNTITGNVWIEFTPVVDECASDDDGTYEFPDYLFDYIVWAALSDYYFARGDTRADAMMVRAQQAIIQAKNSYAVDQKQRSTVAVKTEVSEQFRNQ